MNINKLNTSKENIEKKLNLDRMKNLMYGKNDIKRVNPIINRLKELFYKYIKTPILNNINLIKKFKKLRDDEKLKKNFENDKKVLTDRIKSLIDFDYEYGDSKREYLNNELITAKKEIIKTSKPLFYEPEINNIHNENLDNPNLKELNIILDIAYEEVCDSLKLQEHELNKNQKKISI
jgi:glutaredoxin-related protein